MYSNNFSASYLSLTNSVLLLTSHFRTMIASNHFLRSRDIVRGVKTFSSKTPMKKPFTRNDFFQELVTEPKTNEEKKRIENAKEAFERIFTDLKQLQKNNPAMVLNRENGQFVMSFKSRPEVPQFRVLLSEDDSIGFEAPSSPGNLRYYKVDKDSGMWNCVKDGHNLHGLFLRDMIPLAIGLPRWSFEQT